jgi:hypothetical protein
MVEVRCSQIAAAHAYLRVERPLLHRGGFLEHNGARNGPRGAADERAGDRACRARGCSDDGAGESARGSALRLVRDAAPGASSRRVEDLLCSCSVMGAR